MALKSHAFPALPRWFASVYRDFSQGPCDIHIIYFWKWQAVVITYGLKVALVNSSNKKKNCNSTSRWNHLRPKQKNRLWCVRLKQSPHSVPPLSSCLRKNTRFDFACWICLDASLKQSSLWIKISRLENRIAQVENWFIPIIPLKDILNYILEVEKVKPLKKVSLCQKTPFVRILKGIKKEL